MEIRIRASFVRRNTIAKLFLVVFFLLLFCEIKSQTVVPFTTPGTVNWTCPNGVTSIVVECWGGGGAGGGTSNTARTTGGGGAGGNYNKATITVIPGQSYNITVGAGGAGVSNANGSNGQPSIFGDNTLVALGGLGGNRGNSTSLNGAGGAGINTGNLYYGGSGGTGNATSGNNGTSGAGGGGAGNGGNGTNAVGINPGIGGIGSISGGNGAGGQGNSGNGLNGSFPSGGGSGGRNSNSNPTNRSGGNGGNGQVIITYYCPTVTASISPNSICSGGTINLSSTATSNILTTVFQDNFNSATNSWNLSNNSTGGNVANAAWTLRTNNYNYLGTNFISNDASQFYLSNSDAQGSGSTTNTILRSPAFSTIGLSQANLNFYHFYSDIDGGDFAYVEISSDNINWTNLSTFTSTQGSSTNFVNAVLPLPALFLNQSTVYVRFRYVASYDWYWAIDNVSVSGASSTGFTYNWTSNPSGFTSSLRNPVVNNPVANSTYTVAVSNGSCSVQATTTPVSIKTNVGITSISANSNPICSNTTTTLSAQVVGTNAVVNWYSGANGTGTLLGTGSSLSNCAPGTYYARVTGDCGTPVEQSFTLNAFNVPAAPTVTPASICGSGPVSLTANSIGNSINWYTANTGGTLLATSNNSYVTPVLINTTTYYVEAVNTNGCKSNRTPVVATINAVPASPSINGNAFVCNSGTVTLTATAPTGSSVQWYNQSSGGSLLASSSTYTTPSISATTTFYAQSIDNTTNCISGNRASFTVSVFASSIPSVSITSTATNNTICAGTSVTFTAAPVNGGSAPTYQWKVNGVNVGSNSASYTTSTLLNNAQVTVVMTSNQNCATPSAVTSNQITMTVNSLPSSPVGTGGSRCGPGQITLSANPVGPNQTVNWYNSSLGTTPFVAGNNILTTNLTATTTFYAASVDLTTGCISAIPQRSVVIATINSLPQLTCPGDVGTCLNSPAFSLNVSPAGGTYTGPGISNNLFDPSIVGIGTYAVSYTVNGSNGCSNSCEINIYVTNTIPQANAVSSSNEVISGTSTNITLNSNVPGTLFTWSVLSNAPGVTGFANQTTPVPGPINQTIINNSNSVAELVYIITPNLNGCTGIPDTIILTLPQPTFCEDQSTFGVGSCIIDMGMIPQNVGNGLKPYGLLYQLLNVNRIPVYWCINENKSFVNPNNKIDQVDFTVDGRSFKGGPFVIPAAYVPQARSVIDNWVGQGVVVYYSQSAFTPPVYELLTKIPNVVLDENTGDIIESGFYQQAGIPDVAYELGGIPSVITNCDDIYVLPHAEPQLWPQLQKDSLLNFINARGWLFTSCSSVSGIENIPGMNFLSNNGLRNYNQHDDPSAPFSYSIKQGIERGSMAADPYMQSIGLFDPTVSYGLERVFVPNAEGWRPTTKIAVYDSNYVNTIPNPDVTYPNNAAILAYGRAFGDNSKGIIMYMGGHDFYENHNSGNASVINVAAARIYGSFLLRAGIGAKPVVVANNIPTIAFSGQTIQLSVSILPSFTNFTSFEWTSDLGGLFSSQDTVTSFTVPSVDATTSCTIQFKVTDACGRVGVYCASIVIYSTITNNHIFSSQSICAGVVPNTLTGTLPISPDGSAITYRWLMSTVGSSTGFSPAPGINNQQNYTPPALDQTTWFRREAISSTASVVSASIQITTKPTPTVTASATSLDLCIGQSTTISSIGAPSSAFTTVTQSHTANITITNNSATGIRDTISVLGLPPLMSQITHISVKLNITHTSDDDVEVYLIRPGGNLTQAANGNFSNTTIPGQSILLTADNGGGANNYTNTTFVDSATALIVNGVAPFSDYFKPQELFSTLNGNPNGFWVLKVVDDRGKNGGSGTLDNWTISFTIANGVTYLWSSSPAGFSSSIQNPGLVTPTESTTYFVTVAEPGNTCTRTDSLPVVVSPLTESGTISGPTDICIGDNTGLLSLNGYVGSIQWQSSTDGINFIDISGATAATHALFGLNVNTYYRAKVKSGACSEALTAQFLVQVHASPTIAIDNITGVVVLDCENDSIELNALATGQLSILWNNGLGANTTVFITDPGTYIATAIGSGGCNAVDSISITFASLSSKWIANSSSTDLSWHNPDNWCGGVPDEFRDAIIPNTSGNDPIITMFDARVRNLTIEQGATLYIDDEELELFGDLFADHNLNAINGEIKLSGHSQIQTIKGSYFVNETIGGLILSNQLGVSLQGTNDTLKIKYKLEFGSSNVTLFTNGNLTMLSDQYHTAYVADMTDEGRLSGNKIIGDVTVERFIPNHSKAWQFLSTPAFGKTVRSTWQEGALTPSTNNLIDNPQPGYGTMISGNFGGSAAGARNLGFDIYSPVGPSMKTYRPTDNSWIGIPSTDISIANPNGYMLFVRGDRSVTRFDQAASQTKLRMTGTLYQPLNPPTPITVMAGKFASVGNPYASALDLSKLQRTGGVQDVYYVWDPLLTSGPSSAYGLGGYRTIINTGNGYMVVPAEGSYANGNVNIESGQAFFVRADSTSGGSVIFSETAKSTESNLVTRAALPSHMLSVNLLLQTATDGILLDGALTITSEVYSNLVDIDDAQKLFNPGAEMIAIVKNGKRLVAEKRRPISASDTIFYQLSSLRRQNYRLDFNALSLLPTNLNARLIDNYLGSSTLLPGNAESSYYFSVNADPRSSASDRFMVVFNESTRSPRNLSVSTNQSGLIEKNEEITKSNNVKCFVVFPNPVENHNINIRFSNFEKGKYQIKLLNEEGKLIASKNLILSNGVELHSWGVLKSIPAGVFTITVTNGDGEEHSTQIIMK